MLEELFVGQFTYNQILDLNSIIGDGSYGTFFGTYEEENIAYIYVPVNFSQLLELEKAGLTKNKMSEVTVEEMPLSIAKESKFKVFSHVPLKSEDKDFINSLNIVRNSMPGDSFETLNFVVSFDLDQKKKNHIYQNGGFYDFVLHKGKECMIFIYSSNQQELESGLTEKGKAYIKQEVREIE